MKVRGKDVEAPTKETHRLRVKLKSRRYLIKSRRCLIKSRRDLLKSRRDLMFFLTTDVVVTLGSVPTTSVMEGGVEKIFAHH